MKTNLASWWAVSLAILILASGGNGANGAEPPVSGPSWLTTRVFSGKGGFSLYGMEAESDLRPSSGDPYMLARFDPVFPEAWAVQAPGPDGFVPVEASLPDMSWASGVAYAFLYYRCPDAADLRLHLVHGGTGSFLWCDGQPVFLAADAHPLSAAPAQTAGNAVGVTDQGNTLDTRLAKREGPRVAALPGGPGWHRLLVKLVCQEGKGGSLAFSGLLTDAAGKTPSGLNTAVADPEGDAALHASAARLFPLVKADAPFNLAHPGRPLKLSVILQPIAQRKAVGPSGRPADPAPPAPAPFSAVVRLRVTDYDGKEIFQRAVPATLPGTIDIDLGPAPGPGAYAVHLALEDASGSPVYTYFPDGFNVIGGTVAMESRKAQRKMAVTYYFMAKLRQTLFFPYMRQIGIYRNVGGTNGRDEDFYREAHEQGLLMAADFWNHDDPAYAEAYVREAAPYVDAFKSYNEIDITPKAQGTPEAWVKREREEYRLVKQYAPNATVLGGSLARVGKSAWFLECLRLGVDQCQDVWDVHAYPKAPPALEGPISNAPNESELGVESAYRQLGRRNEKPFWMGETGARAAHGADARRWQASTVAKMVAWAESRPDFQVIGFLVPWGYSREQGSFDDIEAGHMPAEAAYYTVGALIDGFPYRRLDLGKGIQAAQFGPTTMAWTAGGKQSVTLPLSGEGPWICVDVVGRVFPLDGIGGQVKVGVGESPVYILTADDYQKLTAFRPAASVTP